MNKGRRAGVIRSAEFVAILMAGTMCMPVVEYAKAQGAPAAAVATISIPAQSLSSALIAFSHQTRVEIFVPSSLAAGKTSRAVSGSMSPEAALQTLLSGTGLAYTFTNPTTVRIVSRQAAIDAPGTVAPDGTVMLETITVEGQGESAWGPVDGLIAKQSATGTKTDTPLIETPQSVSVVPREQIEQQGAQSVQAALRYTPGVTADQQGPDSRRDYIISRGFNSVIYQDGLRAPLGATTTDGRAEVYGLERVEALRGPASVLYGQTPPGGIVNLVSKRPTETPLHEVQVLGGTHDRLQGAFDFSGPLDEGGKFLYRLTGLGRVSGTQVDFVDDDRWFIAPSLTWRPDNDTTLTVLGQYSHDKGGTILQYLPALGTLYANPNGQIPRNRYVGEPDFGGYARDTVSLGYSFEHKFDDIFTFRQNLKYTKTKFDDSPGYIFGLGLEDDLRTLRRWGGAGYRNTDVFAVDNQLQADFATGPLDHKLLFGVDYSHVGLDTALWSISQPAIDVYNPVYGFWNESPEWTYAQKQSQNLTGVYLQDQIAWDNWRLTLSGRQDWAGSKTTDKLEGTRTTADDSAFSGRIGLSYLFDNGLAPYVSYGTSFEPVADVAWDGTPFKPTTGQQYEVGIKYQPEGFNGFFAASAFHLTQQNVLTQDLAHQCEVFDDPRCGWHDTQTGEVRVRGIELEAKVGITEDFDLIGTYTYLDSKVLKSNYDDELGRQMVDTPRHQASLWGEYRFSSGTLAGLTLGAGVRYVGSRYGTSNNTMDLPIYGVVSSKIPDVALVDASVSYDFGQSNPELKGLSLTVNATNLFDKTYVSGCQSERTCFYGPGRAAFATLGYKW